MMGYAPIDLDTATHINPGTTPANPNEERYWLTSYYPLKAEDGTVQGLSSLVQDITDRKRAEKALEKSEEDLRLMADHLPALIAFIDHEERYQFTNATYNRWFNLRPGVSTYRF